MRKFFLLSLFFIGTFCVSAQQPRRLDQPMEVKTCNIRINANAFAAKTFVEIEYYNPQNVEIEGLTFFKLNPGQVITAFQLELNGKYRDGSIEEKWKASNAYNTIVGKRVDPALLQLTHENNYRLNIYPFAPKSSRKITFTIVQVLPEKNNELLYDLPITFLDTIESMNVNINVQGNLQLPVMQAGLLENVAFEKLKDNAFLSWKSNNVIYKNGIAFKIPTSKNEYHYWSNDKSGKNNFALRLFSDVPESFTPVQNKLAVFWDASASGHSRNIDKEISYLEHYIAGKHIMDIEFFVFNSKIRQYSKFNLRNQKLSQIRRFLLSIKYFGTTNFSVLDFSAIQSNVALVFTDGFQSSGSKKIKQGGCLVNCVISVRSYNVALLNEICSSSGGRVIQLLASSARTAAELSSQADNMLYQAEGKTSSIRINETLPIKSNNIFITGNADLQTDLLLKFGNNSHTNRLYQLQPNVSEDSTIDTYGIIQLVNNYEKIKKSWKWEEMLLFGLENKIVTERTAYLVLERIEDYIKFKIAPPKELEEQCAQMNYVYTSRYKRKEIKNYTETQQIENLLPDLNRKIEWWNKHNPEINKTPLWSIDEKPGNNGNATIDKTTIKNEKPVVESGSFIQLPDRNNSIAEVVVTSAFNVKRTARSVSTSVQVVNAEDLNTVRAPNINNALAGKVAGAQVRSQSTAALGRETMIRLRGENSLNGRSQPVYVVDGTIMPDAGDINSDDIEEVTILQGPAAAARFGPDGANGAIVVTMKKGRRNYNYYNAYKSYKLSEMPEMDYMEAIKKIDKDELWNEYQLFKKDYVNDVSFYFDMADHFFNKKLKEMAFEIIEDGIEMSGGSISGKCAAAYLYESWNEFEKAAAIY
ncbi:MAG: hypothetical protein EOP53_04420, partial [Sphingobacteriales bacterium]